ncbi:MAG: hypothetical protein AAF636_07720 [Pseudomonadota bacterium]
MVRISFIALVLLGMTPVLAQTEKEISCDYQAEVVAAIQKARLGEIDQTSVPDTIQRGAKWPEKFNAIIPIVTPWIYDLPLTDVQSNDLSQIWREGCLKQ